MSETPLLAIIATEHIAEWLAHPNTRIDTPFGTVSSIRVRCWEPNHTCTVKVYRNEDGTIRFDKDGFTDAAYKLRTGLNEHKIIGATHLYDDREQHHAD